MEDIGKICSEQEFCTHCPAREICGIRPIFYDSDAYEAIRLEVFAKASVFAAMIGTPKLLIPLKVGANIRAMDKRRARELEIHPTYSKK